MNSLFGEPYVKNFCCVIITLATHNIVGAELCQVFIHGGYRSKEPQKSVIPIKGVDSPKKGVTPPLRSTFGYKKCRPPDFTGH